MELGEKIKYLRHRKNMTLRDLEQISGLTDSYISKIEKGLTKNITVETLKSLAKSLDVNVLFLIEDTAVTFDELTNAHNIELPKDVADFIANQKSLPYLILAKRLEEQKIPLEYLEVAIESVKGTMNKMKQ